MTNKTGKRLTGLLLHIPEITTHYGTYPERSIALQDTGEPKSSTDYLDIPFAGNKKVDDHFEVTDLSGSLGAYEGLTGKASLTFHIEGARWNLVFDPLGKTRPVLKLN